MVKIAAALWCLIVALGTPLHSVASEPVKTPITTDYGQTFSMSGDGDFVAVSTNPYSTTGYSGEVKFYSRQADGSYGVTSDTLTGNSGDYFTGDYMGFRIAVAGDGSVGTRLAVSLEKLSGSSKGKVKIYRRTAIGSGSDWLLEKTLEGKPQRAMFGHYGLQFSSDGSRLIIGAPQNDGEGYFQIYHYSGSDWELKLEVSGESGNSIRGVLGTAATISGDGLTAAVSDPYRDTSGVVRVGRVRIYKWQGGTPAWEYVDDFYGTQQQETIAPHPLSLSLSSDGSRLAIGVPSRAGAYVLEYDDTTNSYSQDSTDQTVPVITGAGSTFGRTVALSGDGDHLAIAAPSDGFVRFYEKNGTWSQIAQVTGNYIGSDALAVTSDGLRFAAVHDGSGIDIYSLQDPVAPGTVANLTATPGDEQVALSWTAPNDGGSAITDYEYSLDGGSTWTSLSTTGTSATLTGLTNGSTYSVSIRAVNTVGAGAASAAVSVTPAAVPGAPTDVVLTPGDEQVALSWTAPNDGGSAITDYEYSLDGGSTWTSLSTTGTSATLTGLTNGSTYSVSIRAVNTVGVGAASATVSAVPLPGPLLINDGTPGGSVAETSPTALSGEFLINADGSTQAAIKTYSEESEFIEISAETDPDLDIALRLDEPDTAEGGANVSEIGVMTYEAGKKGLATGRGFQAGSTAQVFLFSEPRPLGSTVVQQDGTWEKLFDVPADIELGDHTIQAQGTLPSGARKAATAGVRVAKRSQAPVNIQVGQSGSSIDLSWASPNDAGGSAVEDYEYSTNDGAEWRSLGTTGGAADIDSESDAAGTPLADGTVYQIRMRAVTAVGPGEPSAAQTLTFAAAPSEPAVPVPSLPPQVLLALLLMVGSLGALRLRCH